MTENNQIAHAFKMLYDNFSSEVESHNAKHFKSEDTVLLYQCLLNAICSTQHFYCSKDDPDYISRPVVDVSKLLED